MTCVISDWSECNYTYSGWVYPPGGGAAVNTEFGWQRKSTRGSNCPGMYDPSIVRDCTKCILNDSWSPCTDGFITKGIKVPGIGTKNCPSENDPLRKKACVNCVLNEWSPCIDGIQTRSIKTAAGINGSCPLETDPLRRQQCSYCELSEWSPCTNGIQTRSIKKEGIGSGTTCPIETDPLRRQECSDCVLDNYWGVCYNGIQTRQLFFYPKGNVAPCPAREQVCSLCELNEWTPCENRFQTRSIKKEGIGSDYLDWGYSLTGVSCSPDTHWTRRQECTNCV